MNDIGHKMYNDLKIIYRFRVLIKELIEKEYTFDDIKEYFNDAIIEVELEDG